MSQGILVITHNGKPPTGKPGGGKRIAYRVGNTVFPIGGQPFTMAPPKPPKPKILWEKLPRAGRWDSCGNCATEDNPHRRLKTDDRGEIEVVQCRMCKRYMRLP